MAMGVTNAAKVRREVDIRRKGFILAREWLASFSMIPDAEGKPESTNKSPEEMARLLELELLEKRAAWQGAAARQKQIRTFSILLIGLLLIGGFFLFFLAITRINEIRGTQPAPAASATP